ncbi:MAG: hypothetical protein ACFFDK_12685 [Promethearchaeota archaeon]
MSLMYCPNCEKNTLTKREDFSFLLAFLLAFTGLGLVIYILYHIDKKKDRCIYCETKCLPKQLKDYSNNSNSLMQSISTSNSLEFKPIELEKTKINFCHNCGIEIDREGMNYCALCGSNID